jgi:hypothetical protein
VGAVMPIPTKVSELALFTPAMLPKTIALLSVTSAKAPIAVEFEMLDVFLSGPAV